MPPITKLLIANRGEIVGRIARTCRAMGIATVGVYSDADVGALHVEATDEAVRVGGARPVDSYLRSDRILDAAARTGADAVHPGYGFLAENPAFAEEVLDAGLVWVGPAPAAVRAMGDKLEARRRAAACGVPLPRGREVGPDGAGLTEAVEDLGLPLLVKAAAGGGGRGMRVVRSGDELEQAVASARREAAAAFNDDRVFLETYLERARHIEVQIIGDGHGNVIHLFERECSIQRRHQKLVEEAPAPRLPHDLREALCAAAVSVAQAVDYTNAGTVEFLVTSGRDGQARDFAFLEVNARLQVEHPVTELVTGLDLVRLQLLAARGEHLPSQQDVVLRGHAVEARLYAEDPAEGYLPTTGTLRVFEPHRSQGVRWDVGVRAGSSVGPFYDALLAKVIAHGPQRSDAVTRLGRSLERTALDGVTTNRDLLLAVLRDEDFRRGAATTDLVESRFGGDAQAGFEPSPKLVEQAMIVAAVLGRERRRRDAPTNPTIPGGFSNDPHARWSTAYRRGGRTFPVHYRCNRDDSLQVWVDESEHRVRVLDDCVLELDEHRLPVTWVATGLSHYVMLPGGDVSLEEVSRLPRVRRSQSAGAAVAPMPGVVVEVVVTTGVRVEEGDLLVVVEAMKMEHRITAPVSGTVEQVLAEEGQQVDADAVLVVVEEATAPR